MMVNENMNGRYICFYPITPFWVGDIPNIEAISSDENLFTETLSEKTFIFENGAIYLAFCKDGMIIVRIQDLEDKRGNIEEHSLDTIPFTAEYLNYLNAIQVLLASALIKLCIDYHDGTTGRYSSFKNSIIRSGEAFLMNFENGISSGYKIPTNTTSALLMGRYLSQYLSSYPISFDQRLSFRKSIPEKIFKQCFDDIEKILNNSEAIKILSHINSAVSEYESLNFRQALILAWFAIEYYIKKEPYIKSWKDYMKINADCNNKKNGKTEDELMKHKRGEQEKALKIYPNFFNLFNRIDEIRLYRNDLVHNLLIDTGIEEIRKHSWGACELVVELFNAEYGIDIHIDGSFQFDSL